MAEPISGRIVVDDGQIRAKLQFHASARERVSAEVVSVTGGHSQGIAARQAGMAAAVSTMLLVFFILALRSL